MRLKPPKNYPAPDAGSDLGDRRPGRRVPHLRRRPHAGVTEWILSTLDKYDAKATFFVLGKNVEMYPDLYQRILDAGHRVGNHTYSHQKGWGMSLERYTEDVDFANDLVHSELFRPPYARITPAQARFLGQRYKLVMWDIISRDYNRKLSPRTCLRNVTKYLAPGGPSWCSTTAKRAFRNMRYALPRTLEKIRQMGLNAKPSNSDMRFGSRHNRRQRRHLCPPDDRTAARLAVRVGDRARVQPPRPRGDGARGGCRCP